jgi:hypothetical protein
MDKEKQINRSKGGKAKRKKCKLNSLIVRDLIGYGPIDCYK